MAHSNHYCVTHEINFARFPVMNLWGTVIKYRYACPECEAMPVEITRVWRVTDHMIRRKWEPEDEGNGYFDNAIRLIENGELE